MDERIINSFKETSITTFDEWISRRKNLTSSLVPILLELDEADLSNLFFQLESNSRELAQSQVIGNMFVSLLEISIIHFFRRSYDHIIKSFPYINDMMLNPNRDLCLVASRCLRYLAEESDDNFTFLRKALENAKKCFSSPNKNSLIFNSMAILAEVGRFFPNNVFGITLNHFPEVWGSIVNNNNDNRLRNVALKVLYIHLSQLPSDIKTTFAESLYVDCNCFFNNSVTEAVHGAVLIFKAIYKLYPSTFTDERTIQTIEKLINLSLGTQYDFLNDIYEFLYVLAKDRKKLFKSSHVSGLFMIMITHVMNPVVSQYKYIFSFLIDFIKIFHDNADFPLKAIIDCIKFAVTNQKYENINKVFKVLSVIFEYFPSASFSTSVFLTAPICTYYLISIKLRKNNLIDLKEHLLNQFNFGLKQDNIKYQKISINILRIFGKLLFEITPQLFETLLPFCYSKHLKIRCLMAQTLPIFPFSKSNNELIRLLLMDESEKVRQIALKQIKPNNFIENPDIITQLLVDSSSKIQKSAIPLINDVFNQSIYTVPRVLIFLNKFILSNASHITFYKSSKTCSLFPLIAKYFTQFSNSIKSSLIWASAWLLSNGTGFKPLDRNKLIKINGFEILDLNDIVHQDFISDGIFNKISETTPIKYNIYQVENEKWIEKRNKYLFRTLKILSKDVIPYIYQILPLFIDVFNTKHSNSTYVTALEALNEFVIETKVAINFLVVFDDLFPTLLKLLNSSNQEVAVSILKLTGTIGASRIEAIDKFTQGDNTYNDYLFTFKSESFFTGYVLKLLTELLKEPFPSVFEAITYVMVEDTENAIPYLKTIVCAFVNAIKKENGDNQYLFQEFELICYYSGNQIYPYLPIIYDILIKNFSSIHCINVCNVLSFYLKTHFSSYSTQLYHLALDNLKTLDSRYLKVLLQFITFSIIYQFQSPELFIEKVENYLQFPETVDEVKTSFLLKSFSMLLQTGSIRIYSSRLAKLLFSLLQYRPLSEINQLAYNLVAFGDIPVDIIINQCKNSNQQIPHLEELKTAILNENVNVEELSFIKKQKSVLTTDNIKNILSPIHSKIQNVFKNVQKPVFNNSRQWIDEICTQVVVNSPSIAIRACSQVIMQSQTFRQDLFPIAFLSCWKNAAKNEKQSFSNIVKLVLCFDQIDPQVIKLAEVLDRVGIPFLIPDNEIAKKCQSSGLSLYYYQRYLMDNKSSCDEKTIKELLQLNSRMGRKNSAYGLFVSFSNRLNPIDKAKWSEQLGEWEKALEIYESFESASLTDLLNCYGHLELWDNFRSHANDFEKMSLNDKSQISIYFAWYEYHAKNMDRVKYYMSFCPQDNLNVILLKSIYLIDCGEYEKAESTINKGYKIITQDLSVFNGSDNNEASERLKFAQNLCELNEVLEMKRSKRLDIPEIWQNRLLNFSHDSDIWMKLIETRSLVLSPEDHNKSYLKMLSVLRKERKWKLIDVYWKRFFSNNTSIAVLISYLKILWSRGKKPKAVSMLSALNSLIMNKDIQNISNEDLDYVKRFATREKIDKIEPKKLARYLRIQANWKYQLYKSSTSSTNSLIEISKIFEESNAIVSDDYRTWSGWAYASSRALSHFEDLRSKFAINAISGFLKASQLRPSNSLDYLCQMFSIFFRYGEEIELPESIKNEIISLPPSNISLVIPQIVAHITHKSLNVRNVVQKIIDLFGSLHFQEVVFSLNVLMLSFVNDTEKFNSIQNIMESLGNKHLKVYKDAQLLIDGMHRSAVTWMEQWMNSLENAARKRQENDKQGIIQLMQPQFKKLENPECEFDRIFIQTFGTTLQKCKNLFDRYKKGDVSVIRNMWDSFRFLFNDIENKMKKIESIQLNKVSEELANKRNFSLAVPGTYNIEQSYPYLDKIEPSLHILNSQQHPRCVYMIDTSGAKWKFLLKGNEDLRGDQRIMQFFGLINSHLKNNRNTSDLNVSILRYAIVPFAPNVGLISWVTGADTLQQLVFEYRSNREICQSIEIEIASKYFSGNLNDLSSLQRFELFEIVSSQTNANEIREMLWLRSTDHLTWLQRNRNFSISTALMSIAGYCIGLGDRHPSNIMIQRHTGRVVHIDFGDSFEVAMNRDSFPERVPFRMTRMIINALDGGCVDGLFRKCCEDVLWVLRENQSSIIAQLEVFVHDPIFYGREIRHSKKQKGILERIACKLSGNDPKEPYETNNIDLDVSKQVDTLIRIASDPHEYSRHFMGWCPFW